MIENQPTQFSRRTFLNLAGASSIALLTGCGSQPERPRVKEQPKPAATPSILDLRATREAKPTATSQPTARTIETPEILTQSVDFTKVPPPTVENYLSTLGQINNPIFRAAGCIVQGNVIGLEYTGHASIFIDDHKRLFMGTLKHVIQNLIHGDYKFFIPGVTDANGWEIPQLTWRIGDSRGENDDPHAYYPFDVSPKLLAAVTDKINQGLITPIERVIPTDLTNLETTTVMSDLNKWAHLKLSEYTINNWLIFVINQGRICPGFSGQSVLIKKDGVITNKSCGLVSGIRKNKNSSCAFESVDEVHVRPHN